MAASARQVSRWLINVGGGRCCTNCCQTRLTTLRCIWCKAADELTRQLNARVEYGWLTRPDRQTDRSTYITLSAALSLCTAKSFFIAASAVAAAARYPRRRWWDSELHQLQRQNYVAAATTGVIYGGTRGTDTHNFWRGSSLSLIFVSISQLSFFANVTYYIIRPTFADATFRPKRKCSKQFPSEQPCRTPTSTQRFFNLPNWLGWYTAESK